MDTPSRPRWNMLLRTARTLIVIVLGLAVLHGMYGPLKTAGARAELLDQLQQDRGARAIAMIHRQETVSLFGVPVSNSIGIEDSEAILRAIRLTPPDQPIDLVLHTPGGPVDPQIGDMPAASIVKLLALKPPREISDEMLVLARGGLR